MTPLTLKRVRSAQARMLASRALTKTGASAAVAECVAQHAVEAELAGHPSHGLRLIPSYCENAGDPGYDLAASPRFVSRRGALTLIDAQRGLGHLAVALAVDCAAARALEHGVGVSAVYQCGHAGRAGGWVERGVTQGCVTLIALGGATPPFAMAAAAGAVPALHTNPLALGVPGREHPLMLDIATSMIAAGKVQVAEDRQHRLPPGSILTRAGTESDDPREIGRGGCLLPFAGHKGFGLSALIEALTVGVSGADAAGCEPRDGALVICLEADAFRRIDDVTASVERLRSRIRNSGTDIAVAAPGDPEAHSRAAADDWIELSDLLLARLRHLAGPAPATEATA